MKPAVIKYLVTDARGEQLTPALPAWEKAIHHARKAANKVGGTVLIFGVVASVTLPIGRNDAKVTRLGTRNEKR